MTLIPVSLRPSEATAPVAAPDGATRPSGRLAALLVLALVVLGGAAYVYLPMLGVDLPSADLAWLGELSATTGLPAATLLAVPAGLVLLVLLVAVRRSRPGVEAEGTSDVQETVAVDAAPRPRGRFSLRRRARVDEAIDSLDTGSSGSSDIADDLVPEMDPRALLLYARSLEGTLNDQEDRLEQVRQAADERHRVELEHDHVRVRATVDLMRREHAHQPGVVALGRTEAAVARLGVEPGFARPLLPSGPAGTLPVTFGIAPAPEPTRTASDADDAPSPEPTAPQAVSGSLVDREAALSAEPTPVELTAAGRPKVRPVPPPPETAPTRRGRLRRGPRS